MKYVFTTCACKCTRACTNCEGVVKYTTSCCERNNEKGSPGLHHTLHGATHWGWHSQVPGSHHSRVLQMPQPQEQEEQDQLPALPSSLTLNSPTQGQLSDLEKIQKDQTATLKAFLSYCPSCPPPFPADHDFLGESPWPHCTRELESRSFEQWCNSSRVIAILIDRWRMQFCFNYTEKTARVGTKLARQFPHTGASVADIPTLVWGWLCSHT